MAAVQSADVALAGAFGHLSVGAVAAVQPVPMEVDPVSVAGALVRTAVLSSGGTMAVSSVGAGAGPGSSLVGGPVPMEEEEAMDIS